MRIVVDENIPHAHEAFGQFGEVTLRPGRSLTARDLDGADALIVRSVTRVGRELLDGTPVRFVGTATIGYDHIDLDYLRSTGIPFADAAGSNAVSVAEYVVAALLELWVRGLCPITGDLLGVVGVGRIGSIVTRMAAALGMRVVTYDPPRALRDPEFISAPIEALHDCSVITLHVPLTNGDSHPTAHMIDADFLARLQPHAIVINTSRGGVARSSYLRAASGTGRIGGMVLDVWEEEPEIPRDLIEECLLATPHIAGYSLDGKVKGTEMMADALASSLGRVSRWRASDVLSSMAGSITIPDGLTGLAAARHAVRHAYDISRDWSALRALLPLAADERRAGFDNLRRHYPPRRELSAYRVEGAPETLDLLGGLGFVS